MRQEEHFRPGLGRAVAGAITLRLPMLNSQKYYDVQYQSNPNLSRVWALKLDGTTDLTRPYVRMDPELVQTRSGEQVSLRLCDKSGWAPCIHCSGFDRRPGPTLFKAGRVSSYSASFERATDLCFTCTSTTILLLGQCAICPNIVRL